MQSQLRTQLLDQLRKLAGPDAVKGPALAAAAAAAGGQHAAAAGGHKMDQTTGGLLPLAAAAAAAAAGSAAAAPAGASTSSSSSGMWHAAMRSLFAEYLQASGCLFTLSVFRWVSQGPRLQLLQVPASQH